MSAVALVAAGSSAAGFALSSALQHHAAGQVPAGVVGAIRLLCHLLTRPLWVTGQILALLSFSLHAVALHNGALVLVQPVMVSGIVLAVPVRAALGRRAPNWGEVRTVALMACGLALFLVASRPSIGKPVVGGTLPMSVTAVGVVVAFVISRTAEAVQSSTRCAGLLGAAAGVLFGLVAGLVKLSWDLLQSGGLASAVLAWPLWTLIAVGLSGVVLNQRAYRVAHLTASMPVLNIVNVLVAAAFGLAVFAERPVHTWIALTGQAMALVCMAVGLRQLSRLSDAYADSDDRDRTRAGRIRVGGAVGTSGGLELASEHPVTADTGSHQAAPDALG